MDIAIPLLVLALALLHFQKRGMHPISIDFILLLFFASQVVLNTVANVLQNQTINNHWVYHTNSFCSQLIFTYLFYALFRHESKRAIILGGLLLYAVFFTFNILFLQPITVFNSYSYALGALIIVVYGLLAFSWWIQVVPALNLLSLKEFWAFAGVMFYFGSSFFILITYQYLSIVSPEDVGVLWKMHNIFLTIGCLLFLKAIMCKKWIQR